MKKFIENDSGILVPDEEPKTESKYPVKQDWVFSMMEEYFEAGTEEYRIKALEMLYTANMRQRSLLREQDYEHRRDLIDQLAVALIGGIPSDWRQLC